MVNSSTRRRVAILGDGMIGEVHRRSPLLPGADVAGVLASSPERSRAAAICDAMLRSAGSTSWVTVEA